MKRGSVACIFVLGAAACGELRLSPVDGGGTLDAGKTIDSSRDASRTVDAPPPHCETQYPVLLQITIEGQAWIGAWLNESIVTIFDRATGGVLQRGATRFVSAHASSFEMNLLSNRRELDGYLKLTNSGAYDTYFYPARPWRGAQAPKEYASFLALMKDGTEQPFPGTYDPTRSVLAVSAVDCNWARILDDVNFSISSEIAPVADETNPGIFYFVNVPSGPTIITSRHGAAVSTRTIQLLPGSITWVGLPFSSPDGTPGYPQ
jgi:hypothetical protein